MYQAKGAEVAILDIKDEASLPEVPDIPASKYYKCDVSDNSEVKAILNKVRVEVSSEYPPGAISDLSD